MTTLPYRYSTSLKTNPSFSYRLLLLACFFLFNAFYLPVFSASIIIDGKTYNIDTLANYKVGPGTQYTSLRLQSNNRLDVFFLKVDGSNPFVSFKAVLGRDSIYGGEQPSAMAKRKSKEGAVYFAGTNGDFYATTGYIGYPIAGCLIESELAKVPTSDRKIIAFDENKIPKIGTMTYNGNIKFGASTFTINGVNHLRGENELILFNQLNGKITRTNAYGTEVLVQLLDGQSWGVNKTLRLKVVKTEVNKGSMAIPKGYAVLSGHGTAAANLNTLSVNDELEITLNLSLDGQTASYTDMVGGDNRNPMLKNGIVETNQVWAELHPRTGIGYSEDKKTIIYCVVDGRGLSAGVTTKQLAQLMKSAGAHDAFNMDGGGSSSMYVKEFDQVNTPSDGTERSVANGIFAVSSAPTDNTISEIKSYTQKIFLPHYGVYMPKFLGYNQYGTLINKDLQGVVLSCTPDVGEIAPDGRFVASGNQGGLVTATYNNIQTQFRVELVTSAKIAFRLDSVLIDNFREYPVQVQSIIGLNTMDVMPSSLSWSVNDPTVCSIENGILKGLKNGKTLVTGQLGDFRDTLKVIVEIPEAAEIVGDNFSIANWSLDASAALNAVLNTQNLPSGWTSGSAVNYVYTTTRAPYIRLSRNAALYSLPDTMKIVFNSGNMTISKLIVSLSDNFLSQTVTKEFTAFKQNDNTEISLPLSSMFDTEDIATFPIRLNYLNFYLGTQTSGQAYTLAMKEIALCYRNFKISGTPSVLMSKLIVYPNPVNGGLLQIRLENNEASNTTVELLTITGSSIRSREYNTKLYNEITFPIDHLTGGTYLIKVTQGEKTETAKIMIH